MLGPLFEALGSRYATLTQTADSLVIVSTSVGWLRLWVIVAVPLFGFILYDSIRRAGSLRAGVRQAAPVVGVLAFCVLVVVGLGYSARTLEAHKEMDHLVLTEWTILGPLWPKRTEIAVETLDAIDLGSGTISAPKRNGSPIGQDKTGYFMRLGTGKHPFPRGTPIAAGETSKIEAVAAIRAMLGFLDGHPALNGRQIETNLDRLKL